MIADAAPERRTEAIASEIYVIGGQYRLPVMLGQGYSGFDKALILTLALDGTYIRTAVEYISPTIVCPPTGGSILFKAATLDKRLLYTCTETEIFIYRVPDFTPVNYITSRAAHKVERGRGFGCARTFSAGETTRVGFLLRAPIAVFSVTCGANPGEPQYVFAGF